MEIPKHIAIILDGNRRYAKKKGLDVLKGHGFGALKVEKLFEWALELKIQELTLYALSTENLNNRSSIELNKLFNICREEFDKLMKDKKVMENGIRIRFIGDLNLLQRDLKEKCKDIENKTLGNRNLIINIALAYGGRQEVINAIKKLFEKEQDINEENLRENLYLQTEPELIIRTGGMLRTSNFLIWQSVYSEWIFLKKLWPEFTKKDLIKCIKDFNSRKRNFGK